jgi:predicted O-linked N-acetylglucosamine transferase (SPINDLY family)
MKRWHEAAATYRRALDLTPGFAAGWSGLGLSSLNLPESASRPAISYLERAAALEPDSAQWSFNLGTGWQRQGNLGAAREAYLKALQVDANHTEARFNLGSVAQDIGDHAQAIEAYRALLDHQPGFGPAYAQLGACLLQAGQIEPWLENYREYRRQCAESLSMAVYGLEASVAIGDASEHASWRDRIVAGEFPSTDEEDFSRNWEQLLFLLLHVDLERGALLQWYRRYDEAATAWYGKPSLHRAARRPGPMRVGYLSGDLRDHVMGRMIFELVTHHDRQRFQPFLYALNASTDSWTSRFRDLGLPFVELTTLPHASAAARIRDDDIDILVDCSGHTRGAQQGILAVKPARVVATHIATPGPVGLKAIDYKLTDELAESADAQQFVIERLWPVPGGVFPWHRYAKAAELTRAPGIRPGAFVCGAFVSLMKLSPRCLHLWRRILDRLPNAILAFSPPTTDWHPSYLRWTRTHGIGDERVAFVPHQRDEATALGRYTMLDVALDPMPCGNVNGTMEALAMGVPVVTLSGVRHGERLGNALLRRYGVTATIARNEDEYVDLVVRLAEDHGWTQVLRQRIRDAGNASAVWDSEARTRALEASFEDMLVEQGIRIP